MSSRRIVDASPLILLAKVGRLDLLRIGDVAVVVPEVVWEEVHAKGAADRVAQLVNEAEWLVVVPHPSTAASTTLDLLDAGEVAVLMLALNDPEAEVVIDDLAGRKRAERLGIRYLGTLGLILAAKRLGLIPAVRPILKDLRRAGFYLSEEFAEKALRQVGE